MTKKSPKRPSSAKHIDAPRLEYDNLLAIIGRNADAVKRLQEEMAIQIRRVGEVQHELDKLKTDVLLVIDQDKPRPKAPAQPRN